ncbi:hypothetical protein BH11BAC1_BH11BAC1_24640 [soil metagenome]
MPSFLSKPDYIYSINTLVLDELTGGEDSIIDELSAEAVEEAKSYLNARYDVAAIFAADGSERNKTILMYCKDIGLYHIYSIFTFREIPEIRIVRYKKAIRWLEQVCEQKINPEGLPINKTFIKTGSNEKRINHQL